jgi:outer membrane protein X
MKKSVLWAACLCFFAAAGSAQRGDTGYRGEKGVSSTGVMLGYAVDNKAALVGVDFRYNVLDRLRLAPSVMYVLKRDNRSAWYVNADAHYLARVTEWITVYPVAGIGFSVRRTDVDVPEEEPPIPDPEDAPDDPEAAEPTEEPAAAASLTERRLGLNVGVGGEVRVSRDIILGAEFRYNLTTERVYDQALFSVRVAYYF